MLQYGIKFKLQHGPEWAMKGQLAEASCLLPNRNQKESVHDKRILRNLKNFSKYWNRRPIGGLSMKVLRHGRQTSLTAIQYRRPWRW